MAGKRVLLTVNEDLFDELNKKAKSRYMNIQEFINDLLRKEVLKSKK